MAASKPTVLTLNLVEYPGIEPGVPEAADLQSTASPLMLLLQMNGAPGGTRTLTLAHRLLRPACLPIPPPGHNILKHTRRFSLRRCAVLAT